MNNTSQNNLVTLCGEVVTEPTYYHEIFGEKFYEVQLAVDRLSGMQDVLPISVSERLLGNHFCLGNKVTVSGQFRSYNKTVGERSKLMLTVFVKDVLPFDETLNPNQMYLTGYICKPPIYRTTPFSREIADVLVAVNRQYNKSDYIPCIVWGRNARFASSLSVGQQIQIVGRVQSRNYQKRLDDETVVTRTAYEVSVSKILLVEDNAQDTLEDVPNQEII